MPFWTTFGSKTTIPKAIPDVPFYQLYICFLWASLLGSILDGCLWFREPFVDEFELTVDVFSYQWRICFA